MGRQRSSIAIKPVRHRAARATLALLLAVTLVPAAPAPASGSPWVVDTVSRTENDIRYMWSQLKPSYKGPAHTTPPRVTAPHAPGVTAAGFVFDGLGTINFARYLAGLPADVVTTPALNSDAQHGAVLLAASTFSHTPPKPVGMDQAFYDIGFDSTNSSNIGMGFSDSESFQKACLADKDRHNLPHVGHRRWLLNPPMKQTGIGFASNRHTTYAFDRSRTGSVSYDMIAWPSAGLFPVEFFDSRTPWSITLNPARYDWDSTGHRVTLKRVADGRTWTFDAGDTNTEGEYFNADFRGFGVPNAFIFRPDPASVTYRPGDEFEVTLSGGIFAEGTRNPVTVTYRTRFMTLDGPIVWPAGMTVTEVSGADRIATAVRASELAFPAGAGTVIIATARNWPDALGGATLAGALDAPILLTGPAALSSAVTGEIRRLGAKRAIILGEDKAVGPGVETALTNLLGRTAVERIGGKTRYETSNRVAAAAVAVLKGGPGGYCGTAFLATGATFPDALGASPLAAANGWPIYLVDPRGANQATISAMKAAGVRHVVVLGETGAVSDAVEGAVAAGVGCTTVRIPGRTRYETAANIASFGVTNAGLCWSRVAIATGADFPDALAGGVLQGSSGSVMLLTPAQTLHPAARAALDANSGSVTEVRFLGGLSAVSSATRWAVADALK